MPIGAVGSATIPKGHLFFSTMHSNRLAGETETFVRYGATERLEVGFGYLWKQSVVRPLTSYTFVMEKSDRPALTGGLFFDSLGGGRSAVFLSAAKSLQKPLGVPASVYLGGARISNEDDLRVIWGGNVALNKWLNASVQHDGRAGHYGFVAKVGSVNGLPLRFGLVLSRGKFSALGPITAMEFDLTRRR